ncbi:ferric reduction oxidase 2-like [Ziziphus jujuba]|uniref:ferric-chelate reductase (NADH) n=1 Tax=Ziziphus jujuba TaxID=326968 RepID=A0A6P3ZI40_ZIZJJ|nr:ferric reduction oxidase 2-like [Ziziphus jujuba]
MGSAMLKETGSHSGMKKLQSAIMLFIVMIFVGYIMIWIMMPTNTFYLQWLLEIHAKTDSTYFGEQGGNILIYTFPILFIATLSCIYLHIGKKNVDSNRESVMKNAYWKSWSRPVLVKGPLGIVSWMELSFLTMFFALLVWSFCSYLHDMLANISQQAANSGVHVWEAKLEMSGLMLGLVGNICLAFLFFPVTRGSSILRLIGLTSESSIKYHIWLGHIVMTIFTAHGLCYIIFWTQTNQISEVFKWNKVGLSNVAGEVALVSGLVMWATSFPRIRRKIFELFFYTHHLYITFVVFFVLHVGFSYTCIMLPAFYLFLIDRYLRFLQSQKRIRLESARLLSCEAVELNFSKCPGLSYTPTSVVFLNVPGISKLQWHPFTVTSSSSMDRDKLSVVIKSGGRWSHSLYQRLSSPSRIDRLEISVEGPYGPASTNFLRHEMIVMVSGGSGITPFISIIRELLVRSNHGGNKIPSILLICAFKKSEDLTMLDLVLPVSGTNFDISSLQLQIEAYVTKEKEPTTDNHKLLQTRLFKPDPSDVPISSVLGQNGWLWLGMIISTSFVIFLLLIGILTRYYIYPIDHNSNMIYSFSSKNALNMLFICVSIITTATAVFLWNKKQNAKETMQIQNTNMPIPMTHSVADDRGLESLSHQSFVQATQVHYGKRPNLKRILLECESSSVGVLVSGPRKMRQQVAAICSSGLANNLHFESISFSW